MKLLRDVLTQLLAEQYPLGDDLSSEVLYDVVGNLSANSRTLIAGDVFLALQGLSSDGVDYAVQAKAKGAWVIGHRAADGVDWVVTDLADRLVSLLTWFYDDPSADLKLIGITGTNGKTSTSHYIAQIMSEAFGQKVAVLGTVGNGIWGRLTESTHTTPDIVSLYRQLSEWRDQAVSVVVMEVSSHAITQGRIAGLRFEVVALTQVTRDHLDFHGSEDKYREVKASFLRDAPARHRVLNLEDSLGLSLAKTCKSVGYGYEPFSFAHINSIDTEVEGLYVQLVIDGNSWQSWVYLYGRFNVENVLCAMTCVSMLGYSFDQSGYMLRNLKPVAGRMQKVKSEPVVIIDYAHTPDALEKALGALREHCHIGKLWVVFGAGGDRDVGKRPLMGQVAEALADCLVITDDNPRSEDPKMIADAILSGMRDPTQVIYISDRKKAICHVLAMAAVEDVILIAGKGHETYQEIAGQRLPFSDLAVVQSCQA